MDYQPSQEFAELLVGLLDDELDTAQMQRLSEILNEDAQAREYYYQFVQLHACISWEKHQPESPQLEPVESISESQRKSPCDAKDKSLPLRVYCFFARPTPLSMSVAALVVGLIITAMAFMAPPFYRAMTRDPNDAPSGQYDIVAEVTGKYEVEWTDVNDSLHRGAFLVRGQTISIHSGLVEVAFREGAVVILQGPCEFTIDSSGAGTLQEGKLAAHVGEKAHGFSVVTPSSRIVDLGTEFGVDVEEGGATHVQVFQGSVQVQNSLQGGTRVLAVGDYVRVENDGRINVGQDESPLQFVREFPRAADAPKTEIVAYSIVRRTPGNQVFNGTLGLDFDIQESIDITHLGVFDDGADGLKRTITADLWRRDDAGTDGSEDDRGLEKIATISFTPRDAGQLVGSNRFKRLAEKISLEPGSYTIAAHGYGPDELVFNTQNSAELRRFTSRNDGRGAISFLRSRFGRKPGDFPDSVDLGNNPHQHAGGTFMFHVSDDPSD